MSDAQERYDNEIASRHGGWGGYSSEPEPEPAYEPQQPAYEPAGYDDLDAIADELPEPGAFGQEGWLEPGATEFDPFGEDPDGQIRSMIRDELGMDDDGGFEEHDQWAAAHDARQAAAAELASAEQAEAATEGFGELVRGAVGGNLGEYEPVMTVRVAAALEPHLEAALTTHLANGGSEEDFIATHAPRLPQYTRQALGMVRDAIAIEDMRTQMRERARRTP